MQGLTVGADPEVVLVDEHDNLQSAIPLLTGTKTVPTRFKYGTLIRDNVNAEFAIDPASCKQEFLDYNHYMLAALKSEIGPGIRMWALPSAEWPDNLLEHPEAREFGCSADFDAWKIAKNIIPAGAEKLPLRTCGGHIHIGNEFIAGEKNGFRVLKLVKILDVIAGIPCVYMDQHPSAKTRRDLYGGAGCHRPKPDYGLEWRTPSNFWLSSPEHADLMYDLVVVAMNILFKEPDAVKNGKPVNPSIVEEIGSVAVIDIINNSRVSMAKAVLDGILAPILGDKLVQRIHDNVVTYVSPIETEWGV